MSTPLALTTFATPDPDTEVSSLTELVTVLDSLVTTEIQGTYTPYVTGDATPAVSDNDKVWVQLDSAGRPLAIKKFYNGSWRKVYSGLPYEIRMFSGDPATYFDGAGLGLTDKEWDGYALCTGDNGTQNLSNLFVVGGQMDNAGISGYSSGWQTNVTGAALKTGGSAVYTLNNNNLPNMTVQLSGRGVYDDTASHSDKKAIVTGKYDSSSGGGGNTITIAEFGADPTGSPAVPQVSIPTIPPFFTLAYCQWVGFA